MRFIMFRIWCFKAIVETEEIWKAYCVSCLLVKEKHELQRDPVSKSIDP